VEESNITCRGKKNYISKMGPKEKAYTQNPTEDPAAAGSKKTSLFDWLRARLKIKKTTRGKRLIWTCGGRQTKESVAGAKNWVTP